MPLPYAAPQVEENDDGWGPSTVPEHLKDVPFAPFSKGDKLGRAADWTQQAYQKFPGAFLGCEESSVEGSVRGWSGRRADGRAEGGCVQHTQAAAGALGSQPAAARAPFAVPPRSKPHATTPYRNYRSLPAAAGRGGLQLRAQRGGACSKEVCARAAEMAARSSARCSPLLSRTQTKQEDSFHLVDTRPTKTTHRPFGNRRLQQQRFQQQRRERERTGEDTGEKKKAQAQKKNPWQWQREQQRVRVVFCSCVVCCVWRTP